MLVQDPPVDIMDSGPTPTMDKEPEPTIELQLMPATDFVPEEKSEVPAYQLCETAMKSMPLGVLVELDEEEWLID